MKKPEIWDKCKVKEEGIMCEAIVVGYSDLKREFDVDYINPQSGKVARMSNISFDKFRPEKSFVRTGLDGVAVFEGDKIQYQLKGGMYLNTGTVEYDEKMCAFVIHTENNIKRYLPLLSECNIFSVIN